MCISLVHALQYIRGNYVYYNVWNSVVLLQQKINSVKKDLFNFEVLNILMHFLASHVLTKEITSAIISVTFTVYAHHIKV